MMMEHPPVRDEGSDVSHAASDTMSGWYKIPPFETRIPQASSASTLPLRLLQSFILRPSAFLQPVIFIISIKPTSFIMFVKNAVFFMAFVAFVNAMPVTEYRLPSGEGAPSLPGGIPPQIGIGVSDGTGFWEREPHLGFPSKEATKGATSGANKGATYGATKGVTKLHMRSSPGFDTDDHIDHSKSPPTAPKPPPPPHGTGGSKGGNKAHVDTDDDDRLRSPHHEKGGHKAHADTDDDDDRSRSPSTTSKPPSPPHGTGGSKATVEPDSHIGVPIAHPKRALFGSIFRELENILAGQAVTSNFQSRSVAIDPELTAELQALVNITATLLRAEGKGSSVDPFQSQIWTLKSKVESGAVPTGELMSAAHGIASFYL
ncbi:hypothetical protein BDM02DRAFT_3123233 [Thelephora ganbajun]|uniref:Uncharacterized protein n=1 Tax=Thelephora ganbajun TaxID=370292 RepID=A0ACB6Z261_THEGA|nr:hypothetical protein BDM02DRAFT_3123233 [Thelephora ganbajun]